MSKTFNDVVKEIENYLDKNDGAHGRDHASEVFQGMITYLGNKNIPFKPGVVLLTAYAHDMFATLDRQNHHELAADYLDSNRIAITDAGFTDNEVDDMIEAVKLHRSTNKEELNPHNPLIAAIRMADKGRPTLENYIPRSIRFNLGREPIEDIPRLVVEHLKEKFGRNGYAMKDPEYLEHYKEDLEILWDQIDELTEETVQKELDKIIEEK